MTPNKSRPFFDLILFYSQVEKDFSLYHLAPSEKIPTYYQKQKDGHSPSLTYSSI
jgi:hypothetical protein